MAHHIVLLPGDGIGPEVVDATTTVLDAVGEFSYQTELIGGIAIDETGTALPDATLEACQQADAVLLGAVGGPKWDSTDPRRPRPEQGLLGIRKGLELFANLRPVKPLTALLDASPLKREIIEGTDLLVVRELTGGMYFGKKERTEERASDENAYARPEVERIARVAFRAARRKVTNVDKMNVLEVSRFWREVVLDVHAREFPDVTLDHLLVDNAAMQLISAPSEFDVIVTDNMFGDILSDEAATLTGSIGMLPSASLGEEGRPGLFEPVHGSAPDIAGQGIANPLATILSAAMLLRHGLGLSAEADALESAVDRALEGGLRTRDLGGGANTDEATKAVLEQL
jgi:3-isopropylmalate dehydrogenase